MYPCRAMLKCTARPQPTQPCGSLQIGMSSGKIDRSNCAAHGPQTTRSRRKCRGFDPPGCLAASASSSMCRVFRMVHRASLPSEGTLMAIGRRPRHTGSPGAIGLLQKPSQRIRVTFAEVQKICASVTVTGHPGKSGLAPSFLEALLPPVGLAPHERLLIRPALQPRILALARDGRRRLGRLAPGRRNR
jgi:hypothetical protein